VEGEQLVIRLLLHDGLPRSDEFGADEQGKHPPGEEEEEDAYEIHDPDPLVVKSKRPGAEARGVVEIIRPWFGVGGW